MVQVQAPQARSYNKVLVLALVVVRQLSRVDDVYIIFNLTTTVPHMHCAVALSIARLT
jgi:hypothetical protein